MKARDLTRGVRLSGVLPPVKGIRTEYADPVVYRARRRNDTIAVTWADGTKTTYFANSEVELAR